jgi:rsbT co-antagonist protein RsbR
MIKEELMMRRLPYMVQKLEAAITDTLSCLEENIFIIDLDYQITWMNGAAENFIDTIKSYLKLKEARDIIGISISKFHKNPSYQEALLKKGDFPIDMQLVLFKKFVARLVVKELIVKNEKIGYILLWKDITEIEKEKEKTQALIDELSTPILPTIMEHTLLVPLVGELSLERLERLTAKLLNECLKKQAEYVLLDFSGATTFVDTDLGFEVEKLTRSVELMGAKVLFCGFTKDMVKNMVNLDIKTDQLSFVSFQAAIRYVVTEMGYRLEK